MSTITEIKIENIKLENIFPSPTNPRKHFDEKGLQELSESISEHGLLQPILVRPIPDNEDKNGYQNYEIVYGERRYRASKIAGMTTIKAEIRWIDDENAFEIQVLENLQREDINPLDEARAFQSLMKKETLDWLASKINKSKKYVLDRVKLLDLYETALMQLELGVLPLGHAVLLSKIDIEKQEKVIKASNLFLEKRIEEGIYHVYCAKTLSQLKEYIAGTMLSFDRVNFDLDDADLIPKAGSCQACPKRTINQNLLFGDITENDLCTDSFCFNAKLQKKVEQNVEKVKEEFGEAQVGEKDQWSSHGVILNKERWVCSNEKTEKYTIPVVINKTGNYDTENLGKTVWVQSPEDLKAEVQEEKSTYNNSCETNQNKKIDEVVLPRYKEVFEVLLTDFPLTIIESDVCKNIVNAFMIERLVSGSFNKTMIVCNLLGIKTDIELTGAALREYKDSLSRDEQYNLQFELSKQLVENHSLEMICNILVLDDNIENDIEMDEEIEPWEISTKRYFNIIGLIENPVNVEEIETEVEEEEIGEGISAVTSTLDNPAKKAKVKKS